MHTRPDQDTPDTLDWTAGGDFDCRGAALVLVRYPDYYPSTNTSFNAGLFLHLTSIQARPDQTSSSHAGGASRTTLVFSSATHPL